MTSLFNGQSTPMVLGARGDDRSARAHQRREDVGRIEPALFDGAQHRRQDLLGRSPASGAIATADFAGDHRLADRMLGAPVRRVNGRIPEKHEERGGFGVRCAAKRCTFVFSCLCGCDQYACTTFSGTLFCSPSPSENAVPIGCSRSSSDGLCSSPFSIASTAAAM